MENYNTFCRISELCSYYNNIMVQNNVVQMDNPLDRTPSAYFWFYDNHKNIDHLLYFKRTD